MRGSTVTFALSVALATVGPVLLAAAPAGARGASRVAGTTCDFSASSHALSIDSTALKVVISVQRQGKQLTVHLDDAQVPCGATAPTVRNVDTISVATRSELALDLRKGALAPGFTNESDGSPEIEIDARFGRTGGLRIRGSKRSDALTMGELHGVHAINLNAREKSDDTDVTATGGYPVVSVLGRGGNDRIFASGGSEFDGPLAAAITVSAGSGNDRVKGTPGRDLIGGGGGNDRIAPGAGTDRIKSLGGVDRLRLRDGTRDYARCGPGNDKVKADRKDRLAGCDQR
jgi:hypothetical protein